MIRWVAAKEAVEKTPDLVEAQTNSPLDGGQDVLPPMDSLKVWAIVTGVWKVMPCPLSSRKTCSTGKSVPSPPVPI
jgi:hypothetical protein